MNNHSERMDIEYSQGKTQILSKFLAIRSKSIVKP